METQRIIVSSQNKHYKWLKQITHKKHRDAQGVFVLEGIRIVKHAIGLGYQPVSVFYDSDMAADTSLLSLSCAYGLTHALFADISDTVHSQGVIGVFKQTDLAYMSDNELTSTPLTPIVVLDQVQDPGNLGTILRTCDALGVPMVYLLKGSVDPFSPKVLRATMGSIFNVGLKTGLSLSDVEALRASGYKLVATSLEESVPLSHLRNFIGDGPTAIIFGNEGNGVSKDLLALSDVKVRIPMRGGAESLNVAIAAAIVLHEIQSKHLE